MSITPDKISTAVLDKFRALSPEGRKQALSGMSDDIKVELFKEIQAYKPATERPPLTPDYVPPAGGGIPTPPAVSSMDYYKGQTYGAGDELVNKIKDIASGIKNTAIESVKHPSGIPGVPASLFSTDTLKNIVKPPYDVATNPDNTLAEKVMGVPLAAMGADIEGAKKNTAEGETGRSLVDLGFGPISTVLGGKLLGKGGTRPINVSTREINAFADAVNPITRSGVTAQEVAKQVLPMAKQVASDLGIKDENILNRVTGLTESFPSRGGSHTVPLEVGGKLDPKVIGNILRGGTPEQLDTIAKALGKNVKDVRHPAIEIMSKVTDLADEPVDQIVKLLADNKVPDVQKAITTKLESLASEYEKMPDGESIAKSLRSYITDINESGSTVGGLQKIKQWANKKMDSLFGIVTPGKEIAVDAKAVSAIRDLGSTIRENLYPKLKELSGIDINPILQRESRAIQARDGIFKTFYDEVAPAEAGVASKSIFGRVIGEGDVGGSHGGGSSLFSRQILSRVGGLKPTPAGEFNKMFRTGLGEIGTGAIPEKLDASLVGTEIGGRKLLTSGGPNEGNHPFIFQIKGEAVKDVSQVIGQSAKREFMDNMTNIQPNPAHTGPVAEQRLPINPDPRLPERYRGLPAQTGATQMADQLGMSAGTIPDRSFTGPAQTSSSNWQYIGESNAEHPIAAGAGTLATTDPKVVESTLQALADRIKQTKPGALRNGLTSTFKDLADQLAKSNLKLPNRFRMQVQPMIPGRMPVRRYGTGYAASAAAIDNLQKEGQQ